LPGGDPPCVDSREARGSEKTFIRLARKFGWDPTSHAFFAPYERHILFFGHIGIGKTTELRRYAGQLNASRRFYVVEVDVLAKLDRNNLQYTEVLMAMVETLLERLHGDGYGLAPDALEPLYRWFGNVVETKAATKEFSAEFKTVAEGGGGIPGLIKLKRESPRINGCCATAGGSAGGGFGDGHRGAGAVLRVPFQRLAALKGLQEKGWGLGGPLSGPRDGA
jgi:hypothetical protein